MPEHGSESSTEQFTRPLKSGVGGTGDRVRVTEKAWYWDRDQRGRLSPRSRGSYRVYSSAAPVKAPAAH